MSREKPGHTMLQVFTAVRLEGCHSYGWYSESSGLCNSILSQFFQKKQHFVWMDQGLNFPKYFKSNLSPFLIHLKTPGLSVKLRKIIEFDLHFRRVFLSNQQSTRYLLPSFGILRKAKFDGSIGRWVWLKEVSHWVFVSLFQYGFHAIMVCLTTGTQDSDQIIVELNLWNCEPKINISNFYEFISGIILFQW